MPLSLQVIMGWLEELAPKAVAEEWDNVGLLVGSPRQEVRRVAVALDASEAVVERAIALEADLLLVHHPLIFRPLKAVRTDLVQGRRVAEALRRNLAVYALHTNLDLAPGGVNDALAAALDLVQIEPLTARPGVKRMKLVVFVPPEYVVAVREALAVAGAGLIGEYSHCTFATPGQGSFLPLAGARPFTGEKGQVNLVDEVRLEAVLPAFLAEKVVRSVRRVHPYEEMAYDLYPLAENEPRWGLGRIGLWQRSLQPEAATLADLVQLVKERLGSRHLRVTGKLERPIRKVAVCGGKGGDLLMEALAKGADVLVTGEAGYHEAQEAEDLGLALVEAGHYETEAVVLPVLARYLEEKAGEARAGIEVTIIPGESPWQEV